MRRFEERVKARMELELAGLHKWIDALKQEHWSEDSGTKGDNTPFGDEAEAGEVSKEQEIRFELLERLIEKAAKLEQALHKIPAGIYGTCAVCGDAIHRQRLEALPEADLCLTCQKQREDWRTVIPTLPQSGEVSKTA